MSWEKRDSSRSTDSSHSGSTTGRDPPPSSNPASRPSSASSAPPLQPPESSWQSAAGASSRPSQDNSSSTGASRRTGSAGTAVGWWQTGEKLHQRLTGRSSEHEPTQPSDGGLSAVHQAEMILQLILDQQRQNAPLQVIHSCSHPYHAGWICPSKVGSAVFCSKVNMRLTSCERSGLGQAVLCAAIVCTCAEGINCSA